MGDDGRLDAFVDAAFAFAVTLLVIGGGAVPANFAELAAAFRSAPAFAIGFSLVAMFWHAHVRWRRLGARSGGSGVWLSLLLVFLVLVYVYPLRLMAQSLTEFVAGGRVSISGAELGDLFGIYGIGFAAMAGCVAALFATSRRGMPRGETRAVVTGELVIWLMLVGTGLASALLSLAAPWLAPWTYALLPAMIGLFAWRHDWSGGTAES